MIRVRQIQTARYASEPTIYCNAQMNSRLLKAHARLDPQSSAMLENAMTRFDMSARAYDRILRVARTIADLDASPDILASHIAEAISYRNLDRSSWGTSM